MNILYTVITSLVSVLTLFIIVKVIGNREMSQLSMFDYVNSITIGSIAAELATCEKWEFYAPLTAMIVYGLFIMLLAFLTNRYVSLRRFIEGKALILLDNGKINYENLKFSKMDVNEFLMQCRINGYFNLDDIQTAVLEPNGKVSILPKSTKRPVTPKDMKLSPNLEKLVVNVIVNGQILNQNLSYTKNSQDWLVSQLKLSGVKDISDVVLATCDFNNKFTVYKKTNSEKNVDMFNI